MPKFVDKKLKVCYNLYNIDPTKKTEVLVFLRTFFDCENTRIHVI